MTEYNTPPPRPPIPEAPSPRRISRRVLFATGGLVVVGGAGVAAAAALPGSDAPAPAPTARHTGAAPTPTDVASSGPAGAPPPDVPNPQAVDPGQVQSLPEYYVHAGPKVIALTLDDGPHPTYTPQILSLLQRYRITATFNMIGRQVTANRSLVAEVAAAGHMVANHTFDHADQSKLRLAAVRSEIARTNDALHTAGITPAIFRAPYGAWSHTVFEACAEARLRPVDWSVDPRDWSRPGTQNIIHRIMAATRTGSIILEHDGGGDRSQTVAALKVVLPELLAAGYRFTTV